MDERVTLSMNEIKRLYVIQQVSEKKMTAGQAAQHLGLSLRQVRRLVAKFREKGAPGLVHGNRGRPAHNRVAEAVRGKVQALAQGDYRDYNDSHFTEELQEEHEVNLSRSTVRRLRRAIGQKSPRQHRSPRHRSRRERKPRVGLLLQADGSHHDWLEGRGPWLTLMAYIDDASNEVMGATFGREEDAAGYFGGLRQICLQCGIPAGVYADRHTIFQSPKKISVEQELVGEQPKSQYGRLLAELGIDLIAAQSPQAKGRVERLWGTLQEQANQVLADFLPRFNRRFRVEPRESESAFVPWPSELQLEDFFCFKHTRMVTNDNTFPFAGHRLQLPPGPAQSSYAHKRVEVRQHLDGRLEVRYQGQRITIFQPESDQPVRVEKFSPAPGQTAELKRAAAKAHQKPNPVKAWKPAANHPWRQYPTRREEMTEEQNQAK
jgi:transposase